MACYPAEWIVFPDCYAYRASYPADTAAVILGYTTLNPLMFEGPLQADCFADPMEFGFTWPPLSAVRQSRLIKFADMYGYTLDNYLAQRHSTIAARCYVHYCYISDYDAGAGTATVLPTGATVPFDLDLTNACQIYAAHPNTMWAADSWTWIVLGEDARDQNGDEGSGRFVRGHGVKYPVALAGAAILEPTPRTVTIIQMPDAANPYFLVRTVNRFGTTVDIEVLLDKPSDAQLRIPGMEDTVHRRRAWMAPEADLHAAYVLQAPVDVWLSLNLVVKHRL